MKLKQQDKKVNYLTDNSQNNATVRPSFNYSKKHVARKAALAGGEQNFQLIQAATNLDIDEIELLHKQFIRYDLKKIDSIRYDEIDDIYRDMGLEINENHKQKILQEMDKIDKRYADFKMVCELFVMIKKVIEHEIDEANNADFVNAFTALGGNPDRTGLINKQHIVNIVKNEFELTFDIQKFLGKRGVTNDDLNYQEFCALFEHGDDLTQDILSLFSYKSNRKETEEGSPSSRRPSFEINYKNYNRWCNYDYNNEDQAMQKENKKKKSRKTFRDFQKTPKKDLSPTKKKDQEESELQKKESENSQNEQKQQQEGDNQNQQNNENKQEEVQTTKQTEQQQQQQANN